MFAKVAGSASILALGATLLLAAPAAAAPVLRAGDSYYLSAIAFPNGSGGAVVTTSAISGFAGGGWTRLTLNPGTAFDPASSFTIDAFCIDPPISVLPGVYTLAPLDNTGRGWERPSYQPLSDYQKGALGYLFNLAYRSLPEPAASTPDRARTSTALQMAVWTVLYPSATWSGDALLLAEFGAIMASIPSAPSTARYPALQLTWRDASGFNQGQPWGLTPLLGATPAPAPAAATLLLFGLGALAARRRARG